MLVAFWLKLMPSNEAPKVGYTALKNRLKNQRALKARFESTGARSFP